MTSRLKGLSLVERSLVVEFYLLRGGKEDFKLRTNNEELENAIQLSLEKSSEGN